MSIWLQGPGRRHMIESTVAVVCSESITTIWTLRRLQIRLKQLWSSPGDRPCTECRPSAGSKQHRRIDQSTDALACWGKKTVPLDTNSILTGFQISIATVFALTLLLSAARPRRPNLTAKRTKGGRDERDPAGAVTSDGPSHRELLIKKKLVLLFSNIPNETVKTNRRCSFSTFLFRLFLLIESWWMTNRPHVGVKMLWGQHLMSNKFQGKRGTCGGQSQVADTCVGQSQVTRCTKCNRPDVAIFLKSNYLPYEFWSVWAFKQTNYICSPCELSKLYAECVEFCSSCVHLQVMESLIPSSKCTF
jgi:hypothetical protein